MNDFPDREGTGERGGKFKIGYAQQAKPNGASEYNRGPDKPPMGELNEGRSVGQDVLLIDEEHLIFGVFDGASGADGDSEEAARLAAKTIRQYLVANNTTDAPGSDIMTMAFEAAIEKIDSTGCRGKTTATAISIRELEDGSYELPIGQAGDTMACTIDLETGKFEILTTEQHIVYFGSGARLTNWLGPKSDPRDTTTVDSEFIPRIVKPGTRLIVCSDGVIRALKDEGIRKSLIGKTPQEAADALITASKTNDDKTVLVIDLI